MGSLLGQLIPTAIVGALAPVPIIVVITLLMSRGGLAKAVGFGAALVGVFAVIGAVTLATASVNAGSTTKGSAVTGTIIAVLGAVFLVMALKQILDTPDPDAPPPKFMTRLDSMSVAGATVFGLVLALINLKQLGIYVAGVSLIVQADVSTAQGWVALVILLVVIQLGVIAPIVGYVLARDRATRMLQGFRVWLVGHNRVISIVLGLVVGVWFLIKGVVQIA
jgi:Sap, sulfolipid-1-addressing protein